MINEDLIGKYILNANVTSSAGTDGNIAKELFAVAIGFNDCCNIGANLICKNAVATKFITKIPQTSVGKSLILIVNMVFRIIH